MANITRVKEYATQYNGKPAYTTVYYTGKKLDLRLVVVRFLGCPDHYSIKVCRGDGRTKQFKVFYEVSEIVGSDYIIAMHLARKVLAGL